jgi:diaminohydroxyphosphoribosylaminopyrimidine deaminase/5-amino-6-(5-phosphoribosylamino)uracil reductase
MQQAIKLAAGHHTHPNPRVGAVVVSDDGQVLGEGAHEGVGHDHAEVVALQAAGETARGATLYVTLEPCAHHGHTPPCTDAILAAGIANVVVAVRDPDERVSGSGIFQLRQAGVDVEVDVEAEAALKLDRAYFHHQETGKPFVTLKLAMTLDGSIAALDGNSKWITSEESRADVHRLRSRMDAVVVGAGTLRSDDPLLDVRHGESLAYQPRPVVIAGTKELPPWAKIWERAPLVISSREIDIPNGDLVVVAGDRELPYPETAAQALADHGLLDVLLEGGAGIAGAWLRAGTINRVILYLAGRLGGGVGLQPIGGEFATMADSREVTITDVQTIGPDLRIEFE